MRTSAAALTLPPATPALDASDSACVEPTPSLARAVTLTVSGLATLHRMACRL
jgi:hypothetical protein